VDVEGPGKRVRIYIGEQDKAGGSHRPLWEDLLSLLRQEHAAGATMFRGLAGFGAHSRLHVARIADLVPDLPVLVEWIDTPEQVERLLPRVCQLVQSGTITIDDVTIVKHTHPPSRTHET
jgi:PII-like signaling protein